MMDLGSAAVGFVVPVVGALYWVGRIATRVEVSEKAVEGLQKELDRAKADVEARIACVRAEQAASVREVLAEVKTAVSMLVQLQLEVRHIADVKADRGEAKCATPDCPRLTRHDAE